MTQHEPTPATPPVCSPVGPDDPLLVALDAFMEDDAQDQRETLQFLRRAVDEDRPGQRQVFGRGDNP